MLTLCICLYTGRCPQCPRPTKRTPLRLLPALTVKQTQSRSPRLHATQHATPSTAHMQHNRRCSARCRAVSCCCACAVLVLDPFKAEGTHSKPSLPLAGRNTYIAMFQYRTMYAQLLLALILVAAVSAQTAVSCGNGLTCPSGQTCMSSEQGAGPILACSPRSNAVICANKRFSCPTSHTCSASNEQCTPNSGGTPFKASASGNALDINPRTYGNNFQVFRTDSPGTVKDLGSDICNALITSLPVFCKCSSISGGASVFCTTAFGTIISSWISASFMPCTAAAPIIRYSWGTEAPGQNVAGSQDFSASYETSISITTAGILGISKGVRANLKGTVAGRQITASLGIDLCNNSPSSSSCASQDPSVMTGTDLTGTRAHQPIHL